MRSLLSAAVTVVFCVQGVFAQDNAARERASLAGTWELTLESPHGPMEFTLHVKQEGAKITGTAELEAEAHPLTGSVQQNQVSFSFEARPGALLAFKGAVHGDRMSGSAEPANERGEHEGSHFALSWEATRRQ